MDSRRLSRGFIWGVLGTLAMSVLMLVGVFTGLSPMPQPVPIAIVAAIVGASLPQPLLLALAFLSHLAYGGFWGAVLAGVTRPVTIAKGLGLGVALWVVMGIVVLPFLGWGLFGTATTPAIAVVTLVLHLIYGATLGWVADRDQATEVAHPTSVVDAGR